MCAIVGHAPNYYVDVSQQPVLLFQMLSKRYVDTLVFTSFLNTVVQCIATFSSPWRLSNHNYHSECGVNRVSLHMRVNSLSFVDFDIVAVHCSRYKRQICSSLPNSPYLSSGSQKTLPRQSHPPSCHYEYLYIVEFVLVLNTP